MSNFTVIQKSSGAKSEKFYCVKARESFITNNYELIQFKNGRFALRAINHATGVASYRIVSKTYAQAFPG